MTNRYSTPQAFKTALEERLRTEATKTGTDMGRLRQLLVFDRCLARLSAVFKDALILKGGLALELRLEQARTTKDIDLRIVGNLNQTLARLQEAGQMDLGEYLTFEIQAHTDQPDIEGPGTVYGGERFWAQAFMAGKIYATPFGIDVAFAEPIIGTPDTILGSNFLEFAGIEPVTLRIYPLETHIAEKVHAYTVPRTGSPNSRVKDLPDIALLASVRTISSKTLRSAIEQTFEHRQTHSVPTSVPAPSAAWAPVYARMTVQDSLPWTTLDKLYDAVSGFLNPILGESSGSDRHWNPDDWNWSPGAK